MLTDPPRPSWTDGDARRAVVLPACLADRARRENVAERRHDEGGFGRAVGLGGKGSLARAHAQWCGLFAGLR